MLVKPASFRSKSTSLCLLLSLGLGVVACDQNPGPKTSGPKVTIKKAPKRFEVKASGAEVGVGAAASVDVMVVPKGSDLKINPEFPWQLTLSSSKDLTLAAGALTKESAKFEERQVTFPVSVTAPKAGTYELQGKMDLSVCERAGKKRCFFARDEPVNIKVVAK